MRCCHPGRFEAQVMMSPSIVMNYDLTAWIQRITRWSDTRPPLNSTIKNPYPKKLQKTIYCRIGVYPNESLLRTAFFLFHLFDVGFLKHLSLRV